MSDLSRDEIEKVRVALVGNPPGSIRFSCDCGACDERLRAVLKAVPALLSMADRAAAADEELAQRRANYASCQGVGISARWCPVCGTCTCPNPDGGLDDEECPLHSTKSIHCAPPVEDATA